MELFENDLLREAEELQDLVAVLSRMESYLGDVQTRNLLDDDLLKFLAIIQCDAAYLVGARHIRFLHEKKTYVVPGLLSQLEEVLDNIQSFQAGLPTKKGVPHEEVDE